MKRFPVAFGIADVESSAGDYSQRLGCRPDLLVSVKYVLWRKDAVNLSILKLAHKEGGARRGVGGRGQEGRCYPAAITWMESSADSACWSHVRQNRSASGHGADPSIPRSAYREYESAAEERVLPGQGFWQFPHAVVPAMRAPALSSPRTPHRARQRRRSAKFGWQETGSSARLNPRTDRSAQRQSPAERRPLPSLHS